MTLNNMTMRMNRIQSVNKIQNSNSAEAEFASSVFFTVHEALALSLHFFFVLHEVLDFFASSSLIQSSSAVSASLTEAFETSASLASLTFASLLLISV